MTSARGATSMDFARRHLYGLILVGTASLLAPILVACSVQTVPSPTPQSQQVAQPTARPTESAPAAQTATDTFATEWKVLYDAAKSEGRLDAFVCCTFGEYFDKLVQEFEKLYPGIHVVSSGGSSDEQASKVL